MADDDDYEKLLRDNERLWAELSEMKETTLEIALVAIHAIQWSVDNSKADAMQRGAGLPMLRAAIKQITELGKKAKP